MKGLFVLDVVNYCSMGDESKAKGTVRKREKHKRLRK